jgi:hypothetical protein
MDNVEIAQENLEHAHGHAAHAAPPPGTRRAAILVAVFASVAVIVEMSANDAQTAYLARTIGASDVWNEYQAKSVRRAIRSEAADMLRAGAGGPAAQAAIARADAEAARLADDPTAGGMKQLSTRAHAFEQERDHALHRHEQLERSVRVLQIAIVLVGLYLATRLELLVVAGAVLGVAAIVWGAVAAAGII